MHMRNSALEKVAVKKVKHEVDTIIDVVRSKLEEYVEDESDVSLLNEVSASLAQVERTLQLVQMNGASVLAREMHAVVDGLVDDSVQQKEKAQECLSRGILQLSDYLEYVQAGHKDLPVVLLPLLNDLRGVREAPLLSEHILFFPDLDDIEVPAVNVSIDMPAQEYAKKIRYGYQTGLVSLIQNKEIDIATTKMCKVAIRLHQCSTEIAARRLWWVSSAVTQALAIDALPTSTGLASLLGQVDRQIKKFIELQEPTFANQIPQGLIKNLLYYVGIAQDRGRIVSKVKQSYRLDEIIPTEVDIENMREGLSGPNAEVLEAVSKALHEDIETLKDAIEMYVHSKNRSAESVIEVGKDLQKVADTLSMLGLDEPREDVLREINALNGLSVEELEHADSNFIAIAETLIKAEHIVDNFVNYRTKNNASVELVSASGDSSSQVDDSGQLRKIQIQTITEALTEIEEAKNTFSLLLTEPEDKEKHAKVQDHFHKVMGALSILNLEDAAKILSCIQSYLLTGDPIQELNSDVVMLDAFADSITSVECYLEALIVDEGNPNDILEFGVANASKLSGMSDAPAVVADVQTVEVKDLELDEPLEMLSAADLELKKKSKITDSSNTVEESSLKETPKELDLEDLSATSLDLSIDIDLLDEPPKPAPVVEEQQTPVKKDVPVEMDEPDAGESALELKESDELLELPEISEDISDEILALESTSIEATQNELKSLATGELDLQLDDDSLNVDVSSDELLEMPEVSQDISSELDELEATSLEDTQNDLKVLAEDKQASHIDLEMDLIDGASESEVEADDLLDLPDLNEDISSEIQALESTSIEATQNELKSLANENLDSHLDLEMDLDDNPAGVVEVDIDEAKELDFDEIQEELTTSAKAYALKQEELEPETNNELDMEPSSGEIVIPETLSELSSEDVMEQLNDLAFEITVEIDEEQRTLVANRGESDPDVLEIFIEEAEEEIEKINFNREIWRADEGNQDALVIVRRAFHTLKGGGRLVGAEIIGEYSWLIENILNKVIDETISTSDDLHELVGHSTKLMAELVLQLKSEHVPDEDVSKRFLYAQNFIANQKTQQEEVALQTNIEVSRVDLDELKLEEEEKLELTPEPELVPEPELEVDPVAELEIELEATPELDELEPELVSEKPEHAEQQNELPEVEYDKELFALFLDEAAQHVNTIEAIVKDKQEHKILPVDETLIHALHTLFGCSRTAKVESISKIVEPLDKFCRESNLNEHKIKAEQFDVLAECISYVKHLLLKDAPSLLSDEPNSELIAKAKDLKIAELPVLEDVVDVKIDDEPEHLLEKTQSITLSDTNITAAEYPEDVDVYEGKDADLVEIFLEEANDLLASCNEYLVSWQANHSDEGPVSEIRRQLHTLKGSARMAAYSNIGDLSHELESLVIATVESRISASEDVFNLAQRCLDQLHDMVDQAVNKQPVFPATALSEEISAIQAGEIYLPEEKHADDMAVFVESDQADQVEAAQQQTDPEDSVKDDEDIDSPSKTYVKIPVLRDPVEPETPEVSQPVVAAQQAVRLQSNVLDDLVNNAGEVNIFQARLEQVGTTYGVNINELEQVVSRLREQLRSLEIETETQILSRHAHEVPEATDFDPLELDRYSNIQQLSRSLAESVNDLLSIKDILSDQVHESEILLSQQRRISGDLQEGLMRTRMIAFNQLVPRLQRIVRQTSRELDKEADLKIIGQNTEVDSSILNRIVAPLEHLVRNAISHGIEEPGQREEIGKNEQGEIKITVAREGAEIVIIVTDDGAGLDVEKIKAKALENGLINDENIPDRDALNLILTPGFSTASQVSQVSGRGVGMDVVANELKQLGGSLQIDSELGKGAMFTVHIPVTLAITQSLLVKCSNEIYAVPLASVEGVVRLSAHELKQKYDESNASYHYADREYRLCHLGSLLSVCKPKLDGADKMFPVLLVRSGDSRMALHVEATLGNREVVVKPLAAQLSRLPVVSGATILGDGNVVLILDVPGLIRADVTQQTDILTKQHDSSIIEAQPTVMVVDDSITIRKVTTRFLERNNYRVATAKDGVDAVQKLQDFTPALILLDIEMPRMDGYELATHVRNNERLKNVPIIMITSRTGDKHRQRALDIGVQEYLGKPYNESELLSHVQEILE